MSISPELSKKIELELNEFVEKYEPYLIFDGEINLRKVAADQGILPVLLDMGGCYAIRPNGEIVSFLWDEPYKLEVEKDQRNLNTALFAAVEMYPRLAELSPVRAPDSVECLTCKGTGVDQWLIENGIDPKNFRCYCGGLGWLPADSSQL
jgi:hypothetical protein